jgi:hypothetical protein
MKWRVTLATTEFRTVIVEATDRETAIEAARERGIDYVKPDECEDDIDAEEVTT